MDRVRVRRMNGFLEGPEVEAMMYEVGYLAQALYQATVARRTNQLAESTVVDVEVTKPYAKAAPRFTATLHVEAPHAPAHEFGTAKLSPAHDLVRVLEALG